LTADASEHQRHALVFGASGLIGRHVVLALHATGARVTTATRSAASAERLRRWLAEHGVSDRHHDVRVDFGAPDLLPDGLDGYGEITEIHNCAGSYRFGMTREEARLANVRSVEQIVDLAARLPRLRRLIHVSGYRVGRQDPASVPWSGERIRRTYRDLGPYEASKVEADAVAQTRAAAHGVPWTIVNPSTVIGSSRTGESDQHIGLAANLRDLWNGRLAALPGDASTFVPVVTADHLGAFMALLATDEDTAGASYTVLDQRTPPLPELLRLVATHYRVRVPRIRVPVPIIKRLPPSITRADPETLSFLSSDRYDTGPADAVARRHHLDLPDTTSSILAWADYLAAHRFGAAPGADRRYVELDGIRTFVLGDKHARQVILPGPPVNADTWGPVAELIPHTQVIDLPGLGLSSPHADRDWRGWLEALVSTSDAEHLIGHSIGAGVALEVAALAPDAAHRLTLVAPYFLQPRGNRAHRIPGLERAHLRRGRPEALARRLTGDERHAQALASSINDLGRPGATTRVARLLARATTVRRRHELCRMLADHPGHVHLVIGEHEPLTPEAHTLITTRPQTTLTVIPGAGHHPHLTHPAELARALQSEPADLGPVRAR
jgi:nucleoside-diphosphate-sugar epimerase/pimeloyl-ACP methyl ester carboxylesterase